MPLTRLRWIPATLVLSAALSVVVAGQQFRSTIELVRLPVIVVDDTGAPIEGLTAADFEVREEGQPQEVAYFAAGATGEALPLHVGLLLDHSESMERDLRSAANAAVRFVDQLEEAVDVTYVDFDTAVSLGRFSPPSYPQLYQRIRSGKAGGGTSLYDALAVYVESSLDRGGQHVVLMHTDGGDSTSSMTFGRLQELLRLSDVIVYAVGYLEHQISSARIPQQMRVMQITNETGGQAYFPTSAKEIDEVYERIRAEIAARYTLGYVAPRGEPGFRKIDVRLTRPGLDDAKVRTRSGYVVPAPPGGRR